MADPVYMRDAQPVPNRDYMRDAQPALDSVDPAVVAHAATATPAQAAQALNIADQTGTAPQYAADGLDEAVAAHDKQRFADQLQGRPVLSAWAAQSPQHAALVKPDAEALGKTEGWFSGWGDALSQGLVDFWAAEAMRQRMTPGGWLTHGFLGKWLGSKALDIEDIGREYDSQEHGFPQQVIRAAPQMALYAVTEILGGPFGVAGLIYAQNKGVLARQIEAAQPDPPEGDTEDMSLTPEEIDRYATAGSAIAAVTLAGLLQPLIRSMPGVRTALQGTAAGILSRAAATTAGQAAVRSLAAYGRHTFMGAMGMALQHSINSSTVKKAAGEDVDVEQLARETGSTFLKVLPIAATFAAYGPTRDFLAERGRLNMAPLERAKLDAMVAEAKKMQMAKTAPERLADLFGAMGRGDLVHIDYEAAQKMTGLSRADVAAAEVAQGSVAVPLADYLAKMSDQHEAVADDVKLSADGATMNEARARDKELRAALSPDVAEALLGKQTPDEILQFELPFEKTQVFPAKAMAEKVDFIAELVKQYGGTVEKWQERLTPELMEALKLEGSKGAVAPEEYAAQLVEAMRVKDIDPVQFERLAKKSSKYIQEVAEKARSGSAAGAQAYSPADVAVLSTYELARDVNQAKAAKATEVKAEMDKISADITKQAGNDKLRALLNRAGAPLLQLFDALTEGASVSKDRKGWVAAHNEAVEVGAEPFSTEAVEHANSYGARAFGEAAQWFKESARPALSNERVIERFLAKPRPLEELRPAEVRIINDAVKQLTKTAREENTIRSKDAQATVEEVAGEISGELRQNPSKGLPLPSGVPSSWWRDRLLDANAANAVQLRPKNNLRQKSAAAMKWIFDRINEAVYTRDGFFREAGELWKTAFEAMPKEIVARRYEKYDLSDKLPVQGTEPLNAVPRQWLWKMARHRMSKGNMERVTSTSGWDPSVIDHILFDDPKTKLTVPEWDYLQSLADVNEKYVWPKLKEHFEKFYGVAPPKTAGAPFKVELPDGTFKEYVGGYEPLKRDARPGVAPQAEPTKGIAQYWGRDFQIPWTPGSAKERVDNSHYLVNMDWDSSRATLANALHWLAFDQPVRDVAKLLNDQGLAADMNEFMGQGRADMVRGWLKSSATRQTQSIPEGMEIVGRAFGWQRRLQLLQIVGGSARLAAAQLSHPLGLMSGGEINPIHGVPALLSVFKPMTMANGEVRLFPNWNDAILHGKEVQHRAENAYGTLRRTWDQAGQTSRPGPLGALKLAAQRTAGLYLHAVDRLTTTWAWTAAHNEAVAKGMEPFSEEAKYYANGKTQDVMPVHDIETAAPILTNRQMGGFLIMHGFKNTLYQFRQDALAKSSREFHLAETPGQYGGAAAKTAGRIGLQLAMFGGFAIMGKFALGYGQQPEETKGQWLARDFLAGQSVDLPLIGGLGEPIAKWITGGHVTRQDFTAYGNPGMAAVIKAQELLGSLVNEGREDYKKVFDAVEAVLFWSGVFSRPLRIAAEHLYEMLMGEGYDNVDQSDSAGRFFYTDKQWESIKRSLTPDEVD